MLPRAYSGYGSGELAVPPFVNASDACREGSHVVLLGCDISCRCNSVQGGVGGGGDGAVLFVHFSHIHLNLLQTGSSVTRAQK